MGQTRDSSPQPAEGVGRASEASGGPEGERRNAKFFEAIPEGFAYCCQLYDEEGQPNDWLCLDANPAFERITGLAGVIGRKASDVIPTIMEENPELFQICGKVVESGEPLEFEGEFAPLRLWLHVSLVRPEPGHFAALLSAMTSARAAVEETRTILRTTMEGYYLVDQNGGFLDTNDSYCEMIGYGREELLQMGVRDIEAIDSQEVIRKRIERIMETGHDRFESKHRRKDGTIIDIEASVNALGGDEGKLVVFMRDITERKRVEAVLEDSRRDLLEAQRLARIGSWTYDPATQQPTWSHEMFRIWGLDPELGAPAYAEHSRLIHPNDFPRFDAAVREALEHGTPYEMDLRILRPDGGERAITTKGEALRDDTGKVTGLRGTTQDVTERRLAEEKLAAAASEWRATFDAMSDSVALFDADGRLLRCNAATKAFTGREFQDVLGRPCHEVFHGGAGWHDACPQLAARQSLAGETAIFEQDGRWLRASFQPHRDAAGGFAGGVHVVSDITALKEAEQQSQLSLTQLQAVTAEVIEAIAGIVEARDPYTAGHERRVAELAGALARALDYDAERAAGVRVAALLHDVGKIIVPTEILAKPGKLSALEFRLIQGHPQAGHDALAGIEFPWPVAAAALQHHERLDGSGYPQGLSGDAIIPEARLLAVADVVEAMASHRPYRAALGVEVALAEIEQHRGSLYDAAVVDACLKLFREEGFAFE